jgi:hypothetical protein
VSHQAFGNFSDACQRGKVVENQQAFFSASSAVNVTVTKKRPREYLTETEIERLMDAARSYPKAGHKELARRPFP